MSRIKITHLLLLAALASGCSTSDVDAGYATGNNSAAQISFGTTANWTRGAEINDIGDVGKLEVYSLLSSKKWSEVAEASDLSQYFTSDIYTPFTLTVAEDGSSTSYDVTQYWPSSGMLSFVAYAPAGELSVTAGDDGKPEFAYTMSTLASENDDVVVDARYDLNSDEGEVEFSLQHALTKLSLQVKLIGDLNTDGNALSAADDYYFVNGIVFYDLYNNATLSIEYDTDGSSRVVSWNVDEDDDSTISLTASQNQTLASIFDENGAFEYSSAALSTDSYTDVMAEDNAIFVLPQPLDTNRSTPPTVKVRVRRLYYSSEENKANGDYSEIIYESEPITIPAGGTSGCWDVGQHNQLSFNFNIGKLSEYDTPLTVSSELLDWTTTTVAADIHSNLYIYSSLSNIPVSVDEDGGYYGEFQICTNYDYNLRVPHHREELGGTITSSRGFLFCSDDFSGSDNTNHVGTFTASGKEYKIFVPTLLYNDFETGVEYEIEYATQESVTKYIGGNVYEYDTKYDAEYGGFISDRVETALITGVTADDIVYGSNGYAYIYNSADALYRLLYHDPKNSGDLTAFNYTTDPDTGYHQIDLTNLGSDDGEGRTTVEFKVNIGDIDGSGDDYTFTFSVTHSTRALEGLYTSAAISGDDSYGVNKEAGDAVYTLRLSVDTQHLAQFADVFDDIIGVETISNGGGMMTTYFPVTLSDSNGVIANN